MRIAYVTQWWPPEPASIVSSLARELSQRGNEIDVITGFPNYPSGRMYPGYDLRWRQIEHCGDVRIIRVPLFPSHDRSALKRVMNYASFGIASSTVGLAHLRRPDVAYVYHPPITAAWPARVLRRLRGVPFVLHVQDLWPESVVNSGMVGGGSRVDLVGRVVDRMSVAAYRAAAHIVVISPGFKAHLVARGVDPGKVSVIMNWADEGVFEPAQPDPEARAEMGAGASRIVLYAGNLGDYQGLDCAIRAAAGLRGERRIHLALVGDGVARRELERLVDELGAENVSILAPRPEVEVTRLLAAADAHLVCLRDLDSFTSTIPGKTQVAMAMGKPVLMAVRGDATRLVDEARAGTTCAPGQAGLAAGFEALAALSGDDLLAAGARARQFYVEQLSLSRAADEFETLLCAVSR